MNVMTAAVLKAGKSLKRDFGEVALLQVSRKGPGDFVTVADKRTEQLLHADLAKARPGYGFIMEESGKVEGADKSHTWHIDPLDGTTNFVHGMPHFCISVGLEREGQIVAGIVYNPITEEMFVAEKGQGAFMNNQRLRVSGRVDLMDALISAGIPNIGHGDHPLFLREVAQVMARVAGVRRLGATALDMAFVAAGRFDAMWDRGPHSWDMAAGSILIREAGGFVSDPDGHSGYLTTGNVVAGNEAIHRGLMDVLKKAKAA
jgi:myo-inositol-1(or 4)-monophosphatase